MDVCPMTRWQPQFLAVVFMFLTRVINRIGRCLSSSLSRNQRTLGTLKPPLFSLVSDET